MKKTCFIFLALGILFLAQNLQAESSKFELDSLKSELQELQTKVDTKNKGLLELSSFDTVLSIGGRVQLNAEFDAPNGSFFARSVPLDGSQSQNNFAMSARESRLWVKTRTPTEYGVILTTIEIDFLGSSGTNASANSHNPRLRHAYVELGGFGFGQTNSAFNSIVGLETITFPMDDTFVRQPALRYARDFESVSLDFSFEDPNATLFQADSAAAPTPLLENPAPDFIVRARYYPSWGQVGFAYLSRLIKKEKQGSSNKLQYAWGTNLSGKIETFGLDDIRFNAHYGVGSGRYIGYNAFGSGVLNQNTNAIDLTTIHGGHLGYRHWWSESLRSTFALSYLASDTQDQNRERFINLTRKSQSFAINLLWVPVKNILSGIEFARAKRETYGSQSGTMSHLNLMFRYNF